MITKIAAATIASGLTTVALGLKLKSNAEKDVSKNKQYITGAAYFVSSVVLGTCLGKMVGNIMTDIAVELGKEGALGE